MARKYFQALFLVLLLISVFYFFPKNSFADLIDDLNKQIQEQDAKQQELEKKAQEYQNVIDTKRGEIKSLNNEIAIFDAQISKLEIEINIAEDKITQTNLEILQLIYGLEKAEKDIETNKNNLAEIIRTINQYDQASDIEIILSADNFSDFFSQLTYTESLQGEVQIKVARLKDLKNKLVADKASQEQKKTELENLKSELTKKQKSLNFQKGSRQALVSRTKGEEKKYQQMLAEIETQKKSLLGDINRLIQQKSEEMARIKEEQEKPLEKNWASLSWYYRQNDPAWASETIGMTNSTMANYGCAISSVAMVFTYLGWPITPYQLANEPIFYYDLIVWPKKWNDIQLNTLTFRQAVDWFKIDREIGAGYPVIVRIQAVGRDGGHYVVIHHKTEDGRYIVHDPLFGSNIYLDTSRAYISKLFDTTTSINQMIVYH